MTPRQYISWSSLSLFERSPEQWAEVYLYGKQVPVNRGMAYGRTMADGLENGEATGDPVLDLMIAQLPKFELMDKPLEAEMPCGNRKIKILAKPDTMKEDLSAFWEYKTGQAPWSQSKVDSFGQITFYNTAMYLKTGKNDREMGLVHVQTVKGEAERIQPTGEIFTYRTKRSMSDTLKMMVRIKNAWEGMEKLTESELL